MNDSKIFTSAKEYFESQPENIKKALFDLKDCIYKAAPKAIEMMNYNIPAYALVEGGKRDHQIMLAGYKKHVGLYPHPTVMEKFDTELSEYKKGKGSVQFPLDSVIPYNLVKKIVKFRVKECRSKMSSKPRKKKRPKPT